MHTCSAFACTAIFAIFSLVSVTLSYFVNYVVIRPYMDEIFHIPQVQRYCQGNFTYWDSKITTPPGLYLITVGLLKPLMRHFPTLFSCDLVDLRSINLVFAFGNFYLCSAILNVLNKDNKLSCCWHSAFTTVTICTFPPLYFFTFLYYTDVGSTFAVLLMYLLALHKSNFFAAVIGAFAVVFRQTNIIWVAFCGMLAVIDILEKYASKGLKNVDKTCWAYVKVAFLEGVQLALGRKQEFFQLFWDLVASCGGYITVCVGFLAFVVWNHGIVLGDREAHRATIHIPQIFYFYAFTFIFAFPSLVGNGLIKSLLSLARKHLRFTVFLIVLVVLIIATNTLAHPYLLADNRHYPFYVWRKLLGRNFWSKFFALPLYCYAGFAIFQLMRMNRGILCTVAYCLCLVAALVPQELLEFRYFILPYIILRLNMSPARHIHAIATELMMTLLVNCATLHWFLSYPFLWPHDDVLQRFMW